MPGNGINAAVTRHGEAYNKLQRPDDYHITLASAPAPREVTYPPRDIESTAAAKRKRDDVQQGAEDGHVLHKKAALDGQFNRKNGQRRGESGRGGGQGYVGASMGAESGLRVSLPGLDGEVNEDGDEVEGEGVDEALAYLRGVRNEAQGIPFVLAAEQSGQSEGPTGSHAFEQIKEHGKTIYEGGAVYAVDEPSGDHKNPVEGSTGNLQEAHQLCHERVLERFKKLRKMFIDLQEKKDTHLKQPSTDGQPGSISHNANILRGWPHSISEYDPNTSFILELSDKQLFRGLQHLTELINGSDLTITPRNSRWIWALLAATDDVGTLDNWRVSFVRELASSAGRMQVRINHGLGIETSGEQRQSGNDHKLDDLKVNGGLKAAEQKEMVGTVKDDESDSDMSISEDEESNLQQEQKSVKDREFEAARQRLLDQLGDRLVQPSLPSTTNNADGKAEDQGSSKCYASRAEAEKHRIKLQDDLQHMNSEGNAEVTKSTASESSPPRVHGDLNTRVTIDLILTVAAECYGQRDLLEFRAQ